MPTRAPKVCPHCHKAHTEPCETVLRLQRERKARHDAKRPSRQDRGYDAQWEKLRADYLAAYPCCRRCGRKADVVDHIEPIRKAPHRRLDPTNLQSLCTPCHSGWKQAQDKRS